MTNDKKIKFIDFSNAYPNAQPQGSVDKDKTKEAEDLNKFLAEKLSQQQVANKLGVSVSTVKRR